MTARADITIVAGGWSVRNVAIDRLAGIVIAVNDSALHLPAWHHCVSMDRLWTESRLKRVDELAGETSPARKVWIRANALQNLNLQDFPHCIPFACDHETDQFSPQLQRDPDDAMGWLNGRSSGACALNLAYHLKPGRIFLLGYDMAANPKGGHWYPPYPWSTPAGSTGRGKFAAWADGMLEARQAFDLIGARVFNVSPGSLIEVFSKITPAEYLRLTR